MKYKQITSLCLCLTVLVFSRAAAAQQGEPSDITPAHPTHYFYTPTPYVNDPYSLVVGLHELSFSLPYRLQLQGSIFDNIGRLNVALKYGLLENLSVAAGLAHSLVHVGRGAHGIPDWASPRFGAFLCYGPILSESFELGLTPHTQLGDHISVGVDLGMKIIPNSFWAIILEVGSSLDATDERFYLNFDGGIRINPPSISFLHFDLGVDLEEFPLVDGVRPTVTVYFDILFGMVVN
ncbi:MAG: hypothetical protein JXA30_06105 [Deltaproteobacteria bacterium]|nr:hypothetical protein [Deltaproteobacteria bacterium]